MTDTKKYIIIEDGTSKSQLMKAIKDFEDEYKVTVLKFAVAKNHMYRLVAFDSVNVSLWRGDIDIFLNDIDNRKMYFVEAI